MVPALWHRTNLDWNWHLFIIIQMESVHLFSLFSNKLHLLFNLAVVLKTEFFWPIKFGFIFLSDGTALFFFWLPLSHAVFDDFFFLWMSFIKLNIYLFNEYNCQIVKKWIDIYYKMFRSLSKGTSLNGISNPWQQALVGLDHCFGLICSILRTVIINSIKG